MKTMKEIVEKLDAIVYTLEHVAVEGRNNWDRMLGCVGALDEIKKELMNYADGNRNAGEQRDPENAADPV